MTSFRLWPFWLTVNEGHGPINFCIGWTGGPYGSEGTRFFWYIYAFGKRWHK